MKAGDIMTGRVVSTVPDAGVLEAIELMMRNHISGLPVIDSSGTLVGMVTEGDFLRRAETGTMRKRPRWLEFLVGPSRLAEEYVESHARKVEQVMTREPITITEDTPLDEVVLVMERRRIKRLPVMRGSQVVGIVSRANLMHALATLGRAAPPPSKSDAAIRKQLLAEFEKQFWAPAALIDVVVKNGVVELWGTILEGSQGEALKVCAENIPGVRSVVSRLTWVDTASGLVLSEPSKRRSPTPQNIDVSRLSGDGRHPQRARAFNSTLHNLSRYNRTEPSVGAKGTHMPFQVASLNPCPVCGAETAIAFAGVCLVGAGGGFAPGPAQPATNVATAAPTAAPKPTDYVVKCNEKTITSELTQLSQLAS